MHDGAVELYDLEALHRSLAYAAQYAPFPPPYRREECDSALGQWNHMPYISTIILLPTRLQAIELATIHTQNALAEDEIRG